MAKIKAKTCKASRKALSEKAMFLIAVIGIIFFFTLVMFAKWIKITESETTSGLCTIKQVSYCAAKKAGENPKWSDYVDDPSICSEPDCKD